MNPKGYMHPTNTEQIMTEVTGLTNYTVSGYPILSVLTPFALSGYGMPVCNPNNIDQKEEKPHQTMPV